MSLNSRQKMHRRIASLTEKTALEDTAGIQKVFVMYALWASKHIFQGLRTSPEHYSGDKSSAPTLHSRQTCLFSPSLSSGCFLKSSHSCSWIKSWYPYLSKKHNNPKEAKEITPVIAESYVLTGKLEVVRFPALSVLRYDLDNIKHICLGLYFICLKSLRAALVFSW